VNVALFVPCFVDQLRPQVARATLTLLERLGVEVIVGGDVSCLLHLEGVIRRPRLPIRVLHIAEILVGVEG
jgi:heterodisulfide reductase subunit B